MTDAQPDFARGAVLNTDTGEITIGGAPLPWLYSEGEPALVAGQNGEVLPAIRLSIACTDLTVISPSRALDDEEFSDASRDEA
ncbi:hypothetical protein [Nocardia sp. No.11]|uniref:hypothetical protein n=1 Tax=Nocardia sp. No.11 TaxID=3128861 RepID=UPI00319E454B